jgi:hypothetical protein
MVMATMHDDAAYEAIFRRYWKRWLVVKWFDLFIIILVIAAYAILTAAASGYGTIIRRDASAVPFAFIVMIGLLFLAVRPWSFTAYLDGVIEKRRQRDVTIVKQYLARKTVLPSFRDLEAEMRRRLLSSRVQPSSTLPVTQRPQESGSSGAEPESLRQTANQI